MVRAPTQANTPAMTAKPSRMNHLQTPEGLTGWFRSGLLDGVGQSVARATVSARSVVAATRTGAVATSTATTEGTTVRTLRCLEQTP